MADRLQILMYHRVLDRRDPMLPDVPDAGEFRRQMRSLKRFFHVLPLAEAALRLCDGSLPSRAVSITFDDGYRDNLTVAAPVLRSLSLPATLFVASGYLDGGVMWNDVLIEAVRTTPLARVDLDEFGIVGHELNTVTARRDLVGRLIKAVKYRPAKERVGIARSVAERLRATIDRELMLERADLRKLAAVNFDIGSHTVNHPILTQCSTTEVSDEIAENRELLEATIQKPITGFAYPNGQPGIDYDVTHRNLVATLGFDYAVSTAWGTATGRDDRFQLPRLGFPGAGSVSFPIRLAKSRSDRAAGLLPAP